MGSNTIRARFFWPISMPAGLTITHTSSRQTRRALRGGGLGPLQALAAGQVAQGDLAMRALTRGLCNNKTVCGATRLTMAAAAAAPSCATTGSPDLDLDTNRSRRHGVTRRTSLCYCRASVAPACNDLRACCFLKKTKAKQHTSSTTVSQDLESDRKRPRRHGATRWTLRCYSQASSAQKLLVLGGIDCTKVFAKQQSLGESAKDNSTCVLRHTSQVLCEQSVAHRRLSPRRSPSIDEDTSPGGRLAGDRGTGASVSHLKACIMPLRQIVRFAAYCQRPT